MKIKLVINISDAMELVSKALNTTLIGKQKFIVEEVEWSKYATDVTFTLGSVGYESLEEYNQSLVDDPPPTA
jgi:hypothetical protein